MRLLSRLFGPLDIDKLREARDMGSLEKASRHRDPAVRARANQALTALTSEDWAALLALRDDVPALVKVVNNPQRNTSARSAAVLLLARVPDARTIEALAGVIEHAPAMIAGIATLAIWRVGTLAACERLIQSLEDSSIADDRKLWAAHALGMIGNSAEDVLLKAVQSNSSDSPAFALGTLALVASGSLRASDALGRSMERGFVDQLRTLVASPPRSFIAGLSDSNPTARTLSATALGNRKDHGAIEALTKAARDSNEEVSGQAIIALGKMARTDVVPTIVAHLNSTDSGRRVIATLALGLVEDPAASTAISERLLDTMLVVRAAAVLASKQ